MDRNEPELNDDIPSSDKTAPKPDKKNDSRNHYPTFAKQSPKQKKQIQDEMDQKNLSHADLLKAYKNLQL